MECSDAVGHPVYAMEESAGCSPTCNDEGIRVQTNIKLNQICTQIEFKY